MNFLKIKKSTFLLTLLAAYALSTLPTLATPQKTSVEQPESAISPIDHLVGDAQKQLDQIAIVFVTLSGIISTKQVALANKPKVLIKLRSMTSFIQSLRDRKFVEADIPLVYEFLHLNSLIMAYALDAINSNFENIEKTSLEATLKNNPMPAHVDLAQTAQLLIKNQNTLTRLTYQIDNYGLRWYNHAYRTLDDYVITPCHRYSVPTRVLFALGSAFFCNYMWRQIHYDSYKEYCPKWLQLGNNKPKARNDVSDTVLEPREPQIPEKLARQFLKTLNHALKNNPRATRSSKRSARQSEDL